MYSHPVTGEALESRTHYVHALAMLRVRRRMSICSRFDNRLVVEATLLSMRLREVLENNLQGT